MAGTDHGLKKIFMSRRYEFSSWLLDTEILEVSVEPTEQLPDEQATRPDLVFRVITKDNRVVWLPIEFQGRTSKIPMPTRVLLTGTRLFRSKPNDLITCVVIYIGDKAGKHDPGVHHVYGADGEPTITWKYKVILLWDMDAEEFLAQAQENPALLILIGQTRIKDPAKIIPQVMERVKDIPNEQERAEVLVFLQMLIRDKGVLVMVQEYIESEGLLADTPYLEQVRTAARQDLEEQLHEKDEQLHEKDEQLHEKDEQLHEKDEQLHEERLKIRKLARRLLTMMSDEEISAETGLSLEEVQALRTEEA